MTTQQGARASGQLSTLINYGTKSVSGLGEMLPETGPELLLSLKGCHLATTKLWEGKKLQARFFSRRAEEKNWGEGEMGRGGCVLVAQNHVEGGSLNAKNCLKKKKPTTTVLCACTKSLRGANLFSR